MFLVYLSLNFYQTGDDEKETLNVQMYVWQVFINWSSFVLIEVPWEDQRVKSSKREYLPSPVSSEDIWKNCSLDEIERTFRQEVRTFS